MKFNLMTWAGAAVVDNRGAGFDELNLSETGHGWGAGYAQCVAGPATPCDPAKVNIDVAAQTVTLTSLALIDDPFATGSTCTLDGTARW